MQLIRNASLLFVGALALAACGPEVVGSRYVKSQEVEANQEAVFAVTDAESAELSGTRLEIPAGALLTRTVLTVEVGVASILGAELAAGPSVVFGPAGTVFESDATLVLPLRGLAPSDDVSIVGQLDGVSYEVDANLVALNSTRTLATFRIRNLGTFQPRRRGSCAPACAMGLVCVNGRCASSATSTDGGSTPVGCPMTCPAGTTCDAMRNACVSQPAQCVTSRDCASNFACVAGVCTAGTPSCSMNGACASGMVCVNGQCAPAPTDGGTTNPNSCQTNADCASGQACISNVCRATCSPTVEVCNGLDDNCDGVVDEGCMTPRPDGGTSSCTTNMECATGQRCVSGLCR